LQSGCLTVAAFLFDEQIGTRVGRYPNLGRSLILV
jgi:hypothetical protein